MRNVKTEAPNSAKLPTTGASPSISDERQPTSFDHHGNFHPDSRRPSHHHRGRVSWLLKHLGADAAPAALDVLDNLALFQASDEDDELRQEELVSVLSRYRVNLLVDNEGLRGALTLIENNPSFHALLAALSASPKKMCW